MDTIYQWLVLKTFYPAQAAVIEVSAGVDREAAFVAAARAHEKLKPDKFMSSGRDASSSARRMSASVSYSARRSSPVSKRSVRRGSALPPPSRYRLCRMAQATGAPGEAGVILPVKDRYG
jgi:hypothetical protein